MVTTAGDAGACEGPTVEGGIVGHVAVDIDRSAVTADRQGQVGTGSGCRICQLEDGDLPAESGSGQLVNLGCGCRGEIAAAHRRCAEAWFSVRGNRHRNKK
uniref:RING-CH-type domain-containing protein n=1 Tax=Aegilops tauschii subsp. strangulata TaxID=200361 RepID=A0A452Y6I6_AEGTS